MIGKYHTLTCTYRYTGEVEVQLQIIRNLGARRKREFSITPRPFTSGKEPVPIV
jgi:hypothetical protein